VVLAACGLAVGGAGIWSPTAMAAEQAGEQIGEQIGDRRATLPAASLDLTGLPLPDRVLGEAPRSATPDRSGQAHAAPRNSARHALTAPTVVTTAAAARKPTATYVVRAGDSLWSLAATLLPEDRPADVDAAWRRIHRLNRAVIGREPDLIIPGTTLRLPDHLAAQRADPAHGDTSPTHHREDAS
jgi:nucleoid-associated protein YgaU